MDFDPTLAAAQPPIPLKIVSRRAFFSFGTAAPVTARIGDPDFELVQGAFRSGKWKYIANEWCSGWYTFSLETEAADPLTTDDTVCDGSACATCGFCSGNSYASYLFDLEADPRELVDLIDVYPEVS